MSRIAYGAIVEKGGPGYGLYFPDLPGCVTVGETMTELAGNAREALSMYLEAMTEDGTPPPAATPIEDLTEDDPEIEVVGHMLVEAELADQAVRVNVSLPSPLLDRIDRAAEARGLSRSAFLAEGAKALLKAS